MTNLPSKVWGAESVGIIHLALTETGEVDLTCDDHSNEVTVKLNLRKVRELRLALTRYERQMSARLTAPDASQDTDPHG